MNRTKERLIDVDYRLVVTRELGVGEDGGDRQGKGSQIKGVGEE